MVVLVVGLAGCAAPSPGEEASADGFPTLSFDLKEDDLYVFMHAAGPCIQTAGYRWEATRGDGEFRMIQPVQYDVTGPGKVSQGGTRETWCIHERAGLDGGEATGFRAYELATGSQVFTYVI
ncbi:MAG TPA: hypothetical protein VM327_05525 [Candidatus Thermoplasmatota archaeon]|nr:hypothetical protein [Candidatus Thermoplasmatota archaeon]